MLKNAFWKWDNIIDRPFCDYILDSIDWDNDGQEAKFKDESGQFVIQPEYRQTKVVWRNALHPVGTLLQSYLRSANERAGWNFDIKAYEDVQIGRYSNAGHYDWHTDSFSPDQNGFQRKLTAVLLLNDPSEYEGGVLEIKKEPEAVMKTVGSIVVFPSFLEHRVTEVTSGTRYSAVCWAVGPAFK